MAWLVAVLLVGVGLAVPAGAASAGSAPPGAVGGASSALAQARLSGVPVEVFSERSEHVRVWANPSGSMTAESWAVPRWTRRGDGSWVDIDTSLYWSGGGLATGATLHELRFSGGGDGPLAVMSRGGHTLTWSWPTPLPAPIVDGAAATYVEVLPGVDLRVTASEAGFGQVLVVKTPAAAALPEVRQIRYRLGGDVAVQTTVEGGLRLAAGGQVWAVSGGAVMWDSSTGSAPPTGPAGTSGDARGLPSVDGPGDAETRAVPVRVEGADLVLTPDAGMLSDPGTAWPVFVDPSVAPQQAWWFYANSNNTNWDMVEPSGTPGYAGAKQAKAGKNPEANGWLFRTFLVFPTDALRGARIFAAKMTATLDHSWSCSNMPVSAWAAGAPVSLVADPFGQWRAAWSTPLGARLDTRSVNANETDSDCDRADLPMEFTGGLTGSVQAAATAQATSYTVGLTAHDSGGAGESIQERWKRFNLNGFSLAVDYNSPPAVPSGLSVHGVACGPSRVWVSSATPTLRATVNDPDGEVDLTGRFSWQRWDVPTSTWVALGSGDHTGRSSGAVAQKTVSPAMVHGGLYRFKAQALDPWTYGGSSGTDASAESGWCEFEVDTQNPTAVPGVSSPVYTEYRPGEDEDYHGGVGQTEPFTFTANGVSDVAGYRWGWADPPTNSVAATAVGGPATVQITPPPPDPNDPTSAGQLTLRVRSADRAGRLGPIRGYVIQVGPAAGPAGQWNLADPAGATSLVDSSGNGRTATPTAVTTGQPGRLLSGPGQTAPTVAVFNGSTSQAATAGPVLDSATSFAVAAWVKLSSKGGVTRVVAAQDGTTWDAFYLLYDGPADRWAVTMPSSPASNPVWQYVQSTGPAQIGKWVHLVGVFDRGSGQVRLYVDGRLQGVRADVVAWNATGPVRIGRSLHGQHWHGELAEATVWQRVLVDAEAAALAGTAAGVWSLDGHGFDDSPWGRNLAATAVTWTTDRTGAALAAGSFNGTASQAVTAGPAVRTDQSFTVTCWVRLAGRQTETIVSQDGGSFAAFYLIYDPAPADRWAVTMTSANLNPAWQPVWSTGAPPLGVWTHLAAVYDAGTGQLHLYVNAVLQGSRANIVSWHAGGLLRIGNNMHNQHLNGAVDDVRMYAGALPASEIVKLYQP